MDNTIRFGGAASWATSPTRTRAIDFSQTGLSLGIQTGKSVELDVSTAFGSIGGGLGYAIGIPGIDFLKLVPRAGLGASVRPSANYALTAALRLEVPTSTGKENESEGFFISVGGGYAGGSDSWARSGDAPWSSPVFSVSAGYMTGTLPGSK